MPYLQIVSLNRPQDFLVSDFRDCIDTYMPEFSLNAGSFQKYFCGFCSTDKEIIKSIKSDICSVESDDVLDFDLDNFSLDDVEIDYDDFSFETVKVKYREELTIGIVLSFNNKFIIVPSRYFQMMSQVISYLEIDERQDMFESFHMNNDEMFKHPWIYQQSNGVDFFDLGLLFEEIYEGFISRKPCRLNRSTSPRVRRLNRNWVRELFWTDDEELYQRAVKIYLMPEENLSEIS